MRKEAPAHEVAPEAPSSNVTDLRLRSYAGRTPR